MKALVIEIPGATPERLLGDDDLTNLRRLMEAGVFGPLEGVIPPTTLASRLALATGQAPARLGVHGDRSRTDRSYDLPRPVDLRDIHAPTLENLFRDAGMRSVILGYPLFEDAPEPPADNRFEAARAVLQGDGWDYLHVVAPALDSISPSAADALRVLDAELGMLLELLTDEAVVLVVAPHGARRLEGGFAINDWLVREGLLTLKNRPESPTPLDPLIVDWARTTAWADGGPVASVFLNLAGREPTGLIDPSDLDRVLADLRARLEATADPSGQPLGTLVFRPDPAAAPAGTVPPDLIAYLGGLAWSTRGEVGHRAIHLEPDEDSGACNPATPGAFVLAGSGVPALGERDDLQLLDLAPILLERVGLDIPPTMRDRTPLSGLDADPAEPSAPVIDDDALIRERLSGLGYL